jgi:hypothetical protein
MAVPPVKCDDAPHFTPWEMGNPTKEERYKRKLPDKLRRKQQLFSDARLFCLLTNPVKNSMITLKHSKIVSVSDIFFS